MDTDLPVKLKIYNGRYTYKLGYNGGSYQAGAIKIVKSRSESL